jgi:hypothetical protein
MKQKSASSTGAGFVRARDWQAAGFLMATFFVIAPIALLLILAARERRTPEEDYARAVGEAMQPTSSDLSRSLVSVSLDQPVKVVTWTRQKSISDYQGKTAPAYKDTWVTVFPHLKTFCQDYVKSHGADPKQLSLRLEQRLGLPPATNYDTFVELTVDPKDISNFFRPCGDPSAATNGCEPLLSRKPDELQADLRATDPKKKQEMGARYWFLNTYYNSFASSKQYPWTSLGYTFDWAPSEGGDHLVRFGESEFVIPAGAAIKFNSATDTVAYCTPQ